MILSGVLLTILAPIGNFNDALVFTGIQFLASTWIDAILRFYAGLSLIGIRLSFKTLFTVAILHAITVFLTRAVVLGFKLPIPLVLLVTIITGVIIITAVARMRIGVAFAVILLGMVLTMVGETLFLPLGAKLLGVPLQQALNNNIWQHIFLTYLAKIPYVIVIVLVWLTPLKIADFSERYRLSR